jgi:hypothetical protein
MQQMKNLGESLGQNSSGTHGRILGGREHEVSNIVVRKNIEYTIAS